ncbi:MAG: RidA family protein [Armatimonadota bacterium]
MMTRREIQPASVPRPVAQYAQAVEVAGGRTLFISGQVPIDADGNLVGAGDIREQARQVFRNISALVAEAGGEMSNIVKMTTFLTDMADYAGFVEVRAEFIAPPYPAATLVQVAALVRPEWLLEVEAIAVLP